MRDRKHAWSVLVGTSQRKTPLERNRLRWDDNIEMNRQGVGGWNGMV
jgi:hypothetical protein